MDHKQFLNTPEASEWFAKIGAPVAEHTLRSMRASVPKRGPRYTKLGGKVFYRVADLERYLDQRAVDPKAA